MPAELPGLDASTAARYVAYTRLVVHAGITEGIRDALPDPRPDQERQATYGAVKVARLLR